MKKEDVQKKAVNREGIELMDKLLEERYQLSEKFKKKIQQEVYEVITTPFKTKPTVDIYPNLYDIEVRLSIRYPEESGASFIVDYKEGSLEFSISSKRISEETPRQKDVIGVLTDILENESQFLKGIQSIMQVEGIELKRNKEEQDKIDTEIKQEYFDSELFKKREELREARKNS